MWEVCLIATEVVRRLVGLLFATVLAPDARSEEPKLSISGYDPVAYFTDGKPVQGKSEFEYLWHKLRWRFANGEHRDLFAKDPDRYAPQYDGYCAMGSVGRRGGAQGHGRSRGLGHRRRQALFDAQPILAAGMAGKGRGIHQAGRRQLGGRQGSGGAGDRRAALRRFPADDQGRAARRRALGRRRRAGRARRGRQCRRQGRYAGADRAGRQERRRVPRCWRRDGQGHCLYRQLRHTACRIRQIRRFARALFRPAFAKEHDGPLAAIGQTPISWCRSRPSPQSSDSGEEEPSRGSFAR